MNTKTENPLAKELPPLAEPPVATSYQPPSAPSVQTVQKLWDRFEVAPHIREHSAAVAQVAHHMALQVSDSTVQCDPSRVLAAALLHDIAKTYTVLHGGNHCQIGAAWSLEATGDMLIAHAVYHHVYWPFILDVKKYFMPLAILYADKRVAHNVLVSLEERFQDLLNRYGRTQHIRERIAETHRQVLELEILFSKLLGENLDACSFNRGRLVK